MLQKVLQELKQTDTTLVAVSKTRPNSAILELYEQGQRIFGENRVQELVQKYESLPKDIQWHLIGHLQKNKVKYIAGFVQMIHSVDSTELLLSIDRHAQKHQRIIDCLLQFHIAEEKTKYGLTLEDVHKLLSSVSFEKCQNIRIVGVMGMASFTSDKKQVQEEFQTLKKYFEILKERYFSEDNSFKEISMGMSGDYQIAVEEGSTMVRIGSLLF